MKPMRLMTLLSLIFYCTLVCGQNPLIDSLKTIVESDPNNCKEYDNISWEYVRIDSDSSLFYNQKYYDCATANGIEEREYIYLTRIGNNKLMNSELDSAIYYFSSAKSKISKSDSIYDEKILGVKNNLANSYLYKGEFELAKKGFKECLLISEQKRDTASIAKFYINIGATYQVEGILDSASQYMIAALKVNEEANLSSYNSFIYNNLCSMFSDLGEAEKSIHYCDLLIELSPNENQIIATAYNTKASSLIYLNKLDEASKLLDEAIEITDIPITNYHSYFTFSMLNVEKGKYSEAIGNLLEAKKIVSTTELNFELASVEAKLAECYYLIEDFSAAERASSNAINIFEKIDSKSKLYLQAIQVNNSSNIRLGSKVNPDYHIKEKILRDSFNSIEVRNNINELELKYQTEKKEAQNQLLKNEQIISQNIIGKQRAFLMAAAIGLISILLLLWNQWNRLKERKNHVLQLESKNNSINTLNKEINHRTKNHLALATALLSKYKSKSNNDLVKAAIAENENSLRALMLVNQKLSNSNNQLDIALYDYLKDLCDDLIFSLKLHSSINDVVLNLNCPNSKIDSDICLRIGLIANELITNSFKHSVVPDGPLQLNLDIELKENEFNYTYSDNGTNAKKVVNSQQGLKLVEELIDQLNGKHKIVLQNNFFFEAQFSVKELVAV